MVMEKDVASRLRKAVKEDNLFLVKRLSQRIDMRNPDPGPGRYTSLAWAALKGHEDIFDFLLASGHDDEELSKDADNNTILILLAEMKLEQSHPKYSREDAAQLRDKALRMARAYYDRYPFTFDWSNSSGKTALHVSSLKGNEEFLKMLLDDMGADIDLSDMQGNTPLHYASAWGHVSIVQTLIERGCRFAARNNEGFMAVDYAYSNTTMETLTESGRLQVEKNKRARQDARDRKKAARTEQAPGTPGSNQGAPSGEPRDLPPAIPPKGMGLSSSTSGLPNSQQLGEPERVPPMRPTLQTSFPRFRPDHGSPRKKTSKGSGSGIGIAPELLPVLPAGQSALTPVASRLREKDADAIAHFMDAFRNTGVTTPKSAITVVDPGRPITKLNLASISNHNNQGPGLTGARAAIHKLKQSVSLNQLRGVASASSSSGSGHTHTASASTQSDLQDFDSSDYALTPKASTVHSPLHMHTGSRDSITPPASRRLPFALLSRTTSHQDS